MKYDKFEKIYNPQTFTLVSRLLSTFCKPILYMLFKVHIICELANIVRCVIYRLVVKNLPNMLSNFFCFLL
jgi:hypothetical protein